MASASSSGGEQLIFVLHQHWVRYIRLCIVYLLLLMISLLLFYGAGLVAYHTNWLAQVLLLLGLALLLLNHHWFFLVILSQSENHIIVTDRRVIWIRSKILLQEDMQEYAFDKMKTVEAHKQGLLQYLLRYGTVKFESGAVIHYVPHPNRVVKQIEQAMGMM